VGEIITIDQQRDQGYRKSPTNFLPARRHSDDITMNEQAILGSSVSAAGDIMARRQMSHLSRTDDTAITAAYATLIYSAAYGVAALLITGGIFLLAWLSSGRDGNGGWYFTAWLVVRGICLLGALVINRNQGLWHSSTGLSHHEIESRERVAMYTVDRHIELLEKKWELD
jgi:hypothetical protein